MIWLYSGTPGSGKSLHATKDILNRLDRTKYKSNKFVICNYNLKSKYSDNFYYMDNADITPSFLIDFAINFHKIGLENQSLIVIDEAAIFFNCRDTDDKNTRKEWVNFFREHRKLGYNVILICQFDRMIDRQIRCFVEYEIVHRKLNNAGGFGLILNILHIPMFWTIERWYGAKMVTNKGFMLFSRKVAKSYNTFDLFSYSTFTTPQVKPQLINAVQSVANFATFLIKEKEKKPLIAMGGAERGGPHGGMWYSFLFVDLFKIFKKK